MSRIIVGRLGTAYGVKGWQKCQSFTQPESNLFQYQPWQIEINGDWVVTEYEAFKPHAGSFVVKLPQSLDRDTALRLTNCKIAVDPSQLPELPSGRYYWKDLVGLSVETVGGKILGVIETLMETGANDVIVIRTGSKQHAIPCIQGQVIKRVDLVAKKMIVDWELLE